MPVRIVTADERLAAANNKTSFAIFGPAGCGKTSLLRTLPPDRTVCLDLEAGMKSVQDWNGVSVQIRSFADFRDLDDNTAEVLEVLTQNGKYYWIEMRRVQAIEFTVPERPLDLVTPDLARLVARNEPGTAGRTNLLHPRGDHRGVGSRHGGGWELRGG